MLRDQRTQLGWSQADTAAKIGVTERTYRRWENDALITKLRDREAIRRVLGVDLDAGNQPSHGRVRDAGRVSGKEELAYILDEVRRKATRYNIRRAQGAPAGELDRLRDELEVSVRNGLKAGAVDQETLAGIVDAFVSLLTSESQPPAGTEAAESKRDRRSIK